ncbi:MAG: hypothetical protein ABSF79_04235 [Smithellaceae bacterium]|jgi:Zn-dependent metalloprotease
MKKLFMIPIILLLFLSCDLTPPKSDKELFFIFYKNIIERVNNIDDKLKPLGEAAATNDTLKTIGIATEINDDVSQLCSRLQEIEIPNLKNKEAQKELENAKNFLSSAYFNKSKVVSAFVEASKQTSLYSEAVIKRSTEKSEIQYILGLASLIKSGQILGLTKDEIVRGN